MLPVVAIIGRPNVGKSTLFNCLTRTRNAIMSKIPGTTRDRQYGEVDLEKRRFIIIDTGGISVEGDDMTKLITQQTMQAIEDADHILFLIDGKTGLLPEDRMIANILRKSGKPLVLGVNKTEGLDPLLNITDAHELGMGPPVALAAEHRIGMVNLVEKLFPNPIGNKEDEIESNEPKAIKLAIVGRPNVGKSTLTNRMLGEDRVIVDNMGGTTRDSIFIPLTRYDKEYILIDTAGVRKRKSISEVPEKFSVVKTLKAIEDSHVVLYLIDAVSGVTDQDLKLLGFVLECGKGLVIAVNKWDGLSQDIREHVRGTIDRQLTFVWFARMHFISALHGTGVGNLFASIDEAFESAMKKLSTPILTRLLQQALAAHSPPLVKGRRIKLRYAHAGGHNPPRVIIHGTQLQSLPESYRRFLSSFFQKKLNLHGTPLYVEYKVSENPFHPMKKK